MTWSAPIERTRSVFAVLHTPVTCAPNALASCTAYAPTPPAAPMTRTSCPAWILPAFRSACRAVTAEIGTAAACSKLRFFGFSASRPSFAHAYSAKDPSQVPYTSSPVRKPTIFRPTASTRPATARPRMRVFGFLSP